MRQNPHDSARAYPRLKVFRPAEVRTSDGAVRVHLLDVSCGGAWIHAAVPLPVGTTLVLTCLGRRRTAEVAWVKESRCGIRFNSPLTSEELAALL